MDPVVVAAEQQIDGLATGRRHDGDHRRPAWATAGTISPPQGRTPVDQVLGMSLPSAAGWSAHPAGAATREQRRHTSSSHRPWRQARGVTPRREGPTTQSPGHGTRFPRSAGRTRTTYSGDPVLLLVSSRASWPRGWCGCRKFMSSCAAWAYSCIRPPSRSRRRTRTFGSSTADRSLRPAGRGLVQRAVWSTGVVMIDVLIENEPQMRFTGNQHPVQAVAASAVDPALGDRVRTGVRMGVLTIRTPMAVTTASTWR